MLNELQNKINSRVRLYLNKFTRKIEMSLLHNYTRNNAFIAIKEITSVRGKKVVDSKTKKKIKNYCKIAFANSTYWPYIALYTEIRGEFIEGWIPEDYLWLKILPDWNPHPQNQLCNLKTFDHILFSDFSLTPLFIKISGHFYNSDFELVSDDELIEFFRDYDKEIVVKEEFGRGGKEVSIMKSAEFEPKKLKSNRNYVIQPFIEQHELLNRLNPHSVNTFRVNTFIEDNGSISVRLVFLRFGTNESKVDNLASGGKLIYFDLDGKPSEFAYDEWGTEIGKRHIKTGFEFSNLIFPGYKDMLEKCKDAHRKFPYIRLIGWDVCFDKEGNSILIEWNADRPHIVALEGKFGPLFSNQITSRKKE